MTRTSPPIAVPAAARARALGALVDRGEHAVAFLRGAPDHVLLGFALEGLDAGEQVLVLAGWPSPRSLGARLRAQGIAAPRPHPDALRVEAPPALDELRPFLDDAYDRALSEGYEGLRVAHAWARCPAGVAKDSEGALPRRFRAPMTVLCLYGGRALRDAQPGEAWGLAHHHARILCL